MNNKLKLWAKNNSGLIVNNLFMFFICYPTYRFFHYLADKADYWLGNGTWRTPRFLGNTARSPIYSYLGDPYYNEVKAIDKKRAFERELY